MTRREADAVEVDDPRLEAGRRAADEVVLQVEVGMYGAGIVHAAGHGGGGGAGGAAIGGGSLLQVVPEVDRARHLVRGERAAIAAGRVPATPPPPSTSGVATPAARSASLARSSRNGRGRDAEVVRDWLSRRHQAAAPIGRITTVRSGRTWNAPMPPRPPSSARAGGSVPPAQRCSSATNSGASVAQEQAQPAVGEM